VRYYNAWVENITDEKKIKDLDFESSEEEYDSEEEMDSSSDTRN